MKRFIYSFIILIVFTICLKADLSDGLIAHYQFSDNTNDTSGNNNNAILNNSGSYIDSIYGRAINFSKNGYITTDVNLGKSFTVFITAKSNTQNWSDYSVLGSARVANGFMFQTNINSKDIVFSIMDANGNNVELGTNSKITIDDITKFHTYILSYDGISGDYSVYVDENLKVLQNYKVARADAQSVNIKFGKDDLSASGLDKRLLDGAIDDIKIYNKALNSQEISDILSYGDIPVTKDELKKLIFTNNVDPSKIYTGFITDMSDLFKDNKGYFNGATLSVGSNGVASASSQFSTSYTANQAFDDSLGTSWASSYGNVNNQWLQYSFQTPTVINKYTLSGSGFSRYTIEASNDGINWDKLFEKDNWDNTNTSDTRVNYIAYKYYRLNMSDTGNSKLLYV
ncbi:MAG: discoidin domain-containing protein, partial [Campylobacterales bacterium]|nr:discoidin domain-containing protein [Campylobacterales bacterium]